MQMETDVDDDPSDRTDDTLGSGQFRMDNYPASSGTDSSTSNSD
ncbi:BnaA01g21780D [Brassica napus]|uniref:BnaA01g21780D protein n=1 Tax=Brassica napus TaxID=3708 RepID=A0A078I3Y1_BRANA|nr:BnaA01g21780D [Brassica napus]